MVDLADSNWLRVLAYVLTAAFAAMARVRERRRAPHADDVWPPFWLLTSGFLLAMAIGRLGDLGNLLADLGRTQVTDRGWYAQRRTLQAAIVATVAGVWFILVALAVWRVPERRRRYLPMSATMVTLAAFAAIRVVSLHQVDAVLYHRRVVGVRWASALELMLLAVAVGVTTWIPRPRVVETPPTASHQEAERQLTEHSAGGPRRGRRR